MSGTCASCHFEPVADGESPFCSGSGLSFDQQPLEQDRVEDRDCVLRGHWHNVSGF